METKPEIHWSSRFKKSYKSSSSLLRRKAEGGTHDLVRRCRAEPKTWMQRYDRIAGVSKYRLLEVDIGGAERLIAAWEQARLVLVDMGGHEVVPRIKNADIDLALRDISAASQLFYPETAAAMLQQDRPDWEVRDERIYDWAGSELSSAWIYQLDEEQLAICELLNDRLLEACAAPGDRPALDVVVGGPGTGKTSVLLTLADTVHHELETSVDLRLPDQLREYVLAATGEALPITDMTGPDADVVLIDDPDGLRDIEALLSPTPESGRPAAIVVAMDPLQTEDDLTDGDLEQLQTWGAKIHELTTCYRQKENVGTASSMIMKVIEQSTPFLSEEKKQRFMEERRRVSELSNNVRFVNEHGYVAVHQPWSHRELNDELWRIIRSGRTWEHYPSLLLVTPGYWSRWPTAVTLQVGASQQLEALHVGIEGVGSVKGLEFPHVFAFVPEDLYGELVNGFEGSGQTTYRERRLLRIPFSRGRDSMVTFVLDRDQEDLAWDNLEDLGLSIAAQSERRDLTST